MADTIDRPLRAGLVFPYWLAIILFVVTVADNIAFGSGFLVATAYRNEALVFGGTTIFVAALIWLWVLGATRRFRRRDFSGPIQTVRGGDSMLQPVTALALLTIAAWLAYTGTIPRLTHVFDDLRFVSYEFTLLGTPGDAEDGCRPVRAGNRTWGEQTLCVPETLLAGPELPQSILVTGERSTFGLWPTDYELVGVGVPEIEPTAEIPAETPATAPVADAPADTVLPADTRDTGKTGDKTKN